MTSTQIAFLICGIVFILLAGVCGWMIYYRTKHPYQEYDLQKMNWFSKWIKSNIKTILYLSLAICIVCAVSFFVTCATI